LIEPHPDLDGYFPDDYILVAPDIEPLYVVFQSPRDLPGVVSGSGEPFTGGIWLGDLASTTGVAIPDTIANILKGKKFSTFGKFREAVWEAIAADEKIRPQFNGVNQKLMERGKSPFSVTSGKVGGREKYELHHLQSISEGGAVYDIDNIRILTPKAHLNIHGAKPQ
jgi:hypothetical protein